MDIQAAVDAYVKSSEVGWKFDPFRHLNATADSHLADYLIVDEELAADLWLPRHAVVFGAAGSGKSALRSILALDCRSQRDGRRWLAVQPREAELEKKSGPLSLHALFAWLVRGAANALLLEVAYRPASLRAQTAATQGLIWALLNQDLLFDVATRIKRSDRPGWFAELCRLTDKTSSKLPMPPNISDLKALRKSLADAQPCRIPVDPQQRWLTYCELFVSTLHYEGIFLLLDGFDDYPRLAEAQLGQGHLLALLGCPGVWWHDRVFLKAFLPPNYDLPTLHAALGKLTRHTAFDSIEWNRRALDRVIEQRIWAASGSKNSFNAFASPELVRAEKQIVDALKARKRLLPREAVLLAEQLLIEHVRRDPQPSSKLEPVDLDRALAWYGQQ